MQTYVKPNANRSCPIGLTRHIQPQLTRLCRKFCRIQRYAFYEMYAKSIHNQYTWIYLETLRSLLLATNTEMSMFRRKEKLFIWWGQRQSCDDTSWLATLTFKVSAVYIYGTWFDRHCGCRCLSISRCQATDMHNIDLKLRRSVVLFCWWWWWWCFQCFFDGVAVWSLWRETLYLERLSWF